MPVASDHDVPNEYESCAHFLLCRHGLQVSMFAVTFLPHGASRSHTFAYLRVDSNLAESVPQPVALICLLATVHHRIRKSIQRQRTSSHREPNVVMLHYSHSHMLFASGAENTLPSKNLAPDGEGAESQCDHGVPPIFYGLARERPSPFAWLGVTISAERLFKVPFDICRCIRCRQPVPLKWLAYVTTLPETVVSAACVNNICTAGSSTLLYFHSCFTSFAIPFIIRSFSFLHLTRCSRNRYGCTCGSGEMSPPSCYAPRDTANTTMICSSLSHYPYTHWYWQSFAATSAAAGAHRPLRANL
eukprot:22866-Amphidinium_carterae.2